MRLQITLQKKKAKTFLLNERFHVNYSFELRRVLCTQHTNSIHDRTHRIASSDYLVVLIKPRRVVLSQIRGLARLA